MYSLVSIITPTYNSENQILQTYDSILSQSYTNWEWIVTDDCSSDKTWSILQELADRNPKVKIIQNQQNFGAAISRNQSIKKSSGEYLAFLDSDDLWLPNKLERQLTFMNNNSISFSFTAYEIINENGLKTNRVVDNQKKLSFNYEDMLRKKATLGCSTVILKKKSFDKIEMANIRTGQDYVLWLSLLKKGHSAWLFPQILTLYRIHPNSISRNKFKKAIRQWSIYRKIEKLSLAKSSICFMNYAFRAVFRR